MQKLAIDNTNLEFRLKYASVQLQRQEDLVEEVVRSAKFGNRFYSDLVNNLKKLFECPLSLVELTSPIILPSGVTIQEDCLSLLLKRGNTDPYDKDLKVNDKIVNKFALNVREVIEDSQKKVSAEQDKKVDELSLTNVETQTDLEVRSENDIALIDFYEGFCSRLYNPMKIMTTKIEKENEDENLTQNIELD